ncbi:MAG: CapA family protein [Candidatus Peregrinibacteria bacterium]|nr:CapA family protein [Candidatus Peregrinibacteria bacterium]
MVFTVCGFVVFDLFSGGDVVNDVMKTSMLKPEIVVQSEEAIKEEVDISSGEKIPLEESDASEKRDSDEHLRTLAFGDIMLGRYVRTLMNKYGLDYVFEKIKPDKNGEWFYENSDFVFGNFEGPINGKGTSGGTSMIFSFNEDVVNFLKGYGFNILSIANNHAIDQGWGGRKNTIDTFNNVGLGWCGHPSEEEEGSVYYGENGERVSKDASSGGFFTDGEKVAFVCLHDAISKLNIDNAVALIQDAKENADYVIISVHWGIEYSHKPNKTQVNYGHAFIDAGADFVIGHHPHVVQSFEEYNGKIIFYSLGNFVFDQYWSNDTQEELAIGIDLSHDGNALKTVVDLFPMRSEKSQSRLMTEEERERWIKKFISYGNYDEDTKAEMENFKIVVGE